MGKGSSVKCVLKLNFYKKLFVFITSRLTTRAITGNLQILFKNSMVLHVIHVGILQVV